MGSTENIDPKNVSAFMVHHVLQPKSKSISKNQQKKRRKPKRKALVSVQPPSNKNRLTNKKSNNAKPKVMTNTSRQRLLKPKPSAESKPSKNQSNINNQSLAKNCSEISSKLSLPKISTKDSSSFEAHFLSKTLFEWMISPISVHDFENNYWEKKPLYIPNKRNCNEFSILISTPIIDELLTSADIQYTKNIDITFYENNKKELLNPCGRARPHVVWDFYQNSCSVRMPNPHAFVPNIHKLTSELQEYFGCFVGCNAYLTPPHSQGFAPHYDDIEAFILQIEGKKVWRIYAPRSQEEVLPRFSSKDFKDEDLDKPIMKVVLNPGDLLYLPRGYIHQAETEQDFHSLHITVSAYQCNAWVDLLEKVVTKAMECAWKNDVEFRQGLPRDYLLAAGLSRDGKHMKTKATMNKKLKSLICKLADYIPIDSGVDDLAVKFMNEALPPVLTKEEKSCSIYGDGLRMVKPGILFGRGKFDFKAETEVVLLRKFAARLVREMDEPETKATKKSLYRFYFTTNNALEHHDDQVSFADVPKEIVPCIQYLFQNYPNFVTIKELPYEDLDRKIALIYTLWEYGAIRTKYPMLRRRT